MRPQYVQITQPDSEPITYDQASEHLRVDSTDDQAYIEALIPVAREYVEAITGRVTIQSGWRITAESWTSLFSCFYYRARIYRAPLVSVESIKYWDATTETQLTMDPAAYRVVTGAEPAILQIIDAPPSLMDRPDAIEIEITAGYEDAEAVPAMMKHAIKMMVAHFYEQRVPVAFASSAPIPYTLQALMENTKVGGWAA